YTEYCTKRFDKMKHLFCKSLNIEYEDILDEEPNIIQGDMVLSDEQLQNPKTKLVDKCIIRFAKEKNMRLIKIGRSTYVSENGQMGYIFTTSKAYKQGNREKYWFAYRKKTLEKLDNCREKYVVYGCNDENTLICLPVEKIEKSVDRLNSSMNEDGSISHWHMVFFKDSNGQFTWMVSKPFIEEININEYML
ncbi:MAG: hypothetical protein LUD77_01140, partial [Clostridiales bacterium]|nr:hypothetical protein [Clostridiales bacterium]